MENTYIKMHDLVYDLARWVAGDEVSLLDDSLSRKANAMECRYASVIESNGPSKELGKALPRKVRALNFQKRRHTGLYLPKGIFSYTRCLRVLDLTNCSLYKERVFDFTNCYLYSVVSFFPKKEYRVPTSIYRLKQLRYLRLPEHYEVDERIGNIRTLESLITSTSRYYLHTSIGKLQNLIHFDLSFSTRLLELPDVIGGLQKLHSLKLYGCCNLGSLPESLGNLMKLRALDIRMCTMLDQYELPNAICNMRDLKIQRDEPSELREYDTSELDLYLTNPVNSFSMYEHVVFHVRGAERINLKERGGSIKSLSYHCDGHKYGRAVEVMLEALQPHQNLQELRIDWYRGSMFPSWMMSQMELFLPNLVKITLEVIHNCEHLPVLGQLPKLEEIVIQKMATVRRISEELCGARNTTAGASFPSLKRLELRDMGELEEWVTAVMAGDDGERGASLFPCLEDLTIHDCSELRRIYPCIPPSVRRLSLHNNLHVLTFLDVPEMPLLKHLDTYDYGLDIFPESIRRLTSLETLELRECASLTIFPEWLGELSQLQHLDLLNCPLIDRLPQSIQCLTALKRLRITGCSKSLSERTRKETGEDWDKISHIDNIQITSERGYISQDLLDD